MKPTLPQLKQHLQTSVRNFIRVFDQTGKGLIEDKLNSKKLREKYTDFDTFLETLHNQGIHTLYIATYNKSGNSVLNETIAHEYSLSRNTQTNPATKAIPMSATSTSSSSTTAGVWQGLSAAEQVAKMENAHFTEVEGLKGSINSKDLKIKKLKRKLKIYKSKPGLGKEILDFLKEPETMGVIGSLIPSKTPEVLTQEGLEGSDDVSATKRQFISIIKAPNVQDGHVNLAYKVLDRAMKGDQTFTDLVVGLLNEK